METRSLVERANFQVESRWKLTGTRGLGSWCGVDGQFGGWNKLRWAMFETPGFEYVLMSPWPVNPSFDLRHSYTLFDDCKRHEADILGPLVSIAEWDIGDLRS